MSTLPYEEWLRRVAAICHCEPEELLEVCYQIRELLYDGNASPEEAADWLRANVG